MTWNTCYVHSTMLLPKARESKSKDREIANPGPESSSSRGKFVVVAVPDGTRAHTWMSKRDYESRTGVVISDSYVNDAHLDIVLADS